MRRILLAALAAIAPTCLAAPAAPGTSGARGGVPSYDRDIRPILAEACFACHGFDEKARAAGLRLDLLSGATAKLPTGRTGIVPGNPATSEAYRRVAAGSMPPPGSKKTVTPAQRELLRRWIAAGAKYEEHWAFVPPVAAPLPAVRRQGWVRNPIDRFVLARLEAEGLSPSPEAPASTLLRRLSLDLTGIPPALDRQLIAPSSYEQVVDDLLASPRYGERMAWDWLDAARYADTNGYQGDRTRTMWPWRDWVIRAFNENMPFDRFTLEQLAGDLLPNPTVAQRIATGFHRNHMLNGEGGRIPEESRVDYVVDRVDTTATVWMGLSFGCARCHDHKYDPFTQKDYYGVFGYFNSIAESGAVDRAGQANPVLRLPTPEQEKQLQVLGDALRSKEAAARALPAASEARKAADREVEEARKALNAVEGQVVLAMVMEERPAPRETFILLKGAYDRPGERVSPGVPPRLAPFPADAGPNRLALARWLIQPNHPLTARVAVNRLWQMIFGTGLVKTQEDFGVQGERPSHPELLDWLAVHFSTPKTQGGLGWDMKALLRLLVTSATYRQASTVTPALAARDPENRLLARAGRFRLPSPMIRDQALAASGLLVERVGGQSVRTYQPPGVWEDATFGQIRYQQDGGQALYRRSLYVFWRRIVAPTTFFDVASRQSCSVRQSRTNTPLHALTLLNDVTYVEAARALAQRVLRAQSGSDAERMDAAFRLVLARPATREEQSVLLSRLERLRERYRKDPAAAEKLLSTGESPRDRGLDAATHAAYTGLCSILLNLDETVTRE